MYQPLNQRSSTKGILLGAFLVVACCVFALSYYQVPSFIQLNTVKSYKPSEEAWNIFGEWSKTHNKTYSGPEEMKNRWEIFHNNYYWIKTENAKGYSYTLAVNQFADLTADEFKAMYLRPMNLNEAKQRVNMHLLGLPDSVDWSEKGAVTPVKNQGSCGSCWAFSSTGGLEGAYFLKTGQLQSFSEQQLVDCSKDYQNEGCNGGLMDYSWAYYKDHTAELENDYSYKGKDGTCSHDDGKGLTKITSFVDLATNELALKTAVATVGPVSIAVDAVWWQFYFGGIYNGLCGTNLDHGVLAVGYGADSSGKKYWKIKNSWGASWGEKGYIRVIRGDSATDVGKCGVAMAASYPVL